MRIIPAIDLHEGKCVRLLKGDFDAVTEYSADPAAVAREFSALAVEDLHIVDLDGARTGLQSNRHTVRAIAAESGLCIQLGGGIRSRDDVAAWLDAGVSRCVVGSVAIEAPQTVAAWLAEFGPDAIVLALDVRLDVSGEPILTSRGWTEDAGTRLWDCLDACPAARHVLCTDVSRDGALSGPNFELYVEILNRYPSLQLQASGGVRDIDDLELLRELGVPAAITGRALLDGRITAEEVASFPQSA